MKTFLIGIGLSPFAFILGISVAIFLSGCAKIDAAKKIADAAINQGMDKAYAANCNMRHRTEAGFLARHDISKEAIIEWCKR